MHTTSRRGIPRLDRVLNRRIWPGVAMAAILAMTMLTPASATAPAGPATSVGFDISFPQCGHPYPTTSGFGIVGVNHGHAFSTNPCLAGELRWMRGVAGATRAFYVNTGAPGPGDAHWPRRERLPRECRGTNSTPCAYDYGWRSARISFDSVLGLLLKSHTPSPRVFATSARWWLDVEVANPWETWLAGFGPSRHSELVDQWAVLGSIAYLRSQGISFVGIYSSVPMWHELMGASLSAFAKVPVWIPGSASLPEAELNCATTSFTGGFVAMLQYPSRGYDGDYQCGLKSVVVSASSYVTTAAQFRQQMNVAKSQGPVTFSQNSGSPSLAVSSTGVITTSGPLARGTYHASGTTNDTGGDVGTFAVTLRVGIISQAAPTTAQATVPASSSFSAQLNVNGGQSSVGFTQTTGQPQLLVGPAGTVTTEGTLAAGTYTASGTTSDGAGDTGTFHFTLVVGQLVQLPPTSSTVTSNLSSTFAIQLAATGNVAPVTFVESSGQPSLVVSSSGVVITNGTLAVGTYQVTGTMSDSAGDVGSFTFRLKVTASPTTTTSTTTPVGTTTTLAPN